MTANSAIWILHKTIGRFLMESLNKTGKARWVNKLISQDTLPVFLDKPSRIGLLSYLSF